MSDTPPECALTGTIAAISIGKRGVDLSIVPQGSKPAVQPPVWGNYTCRIDPSLVHLPLMLDIAKEAMRNGLLVWACGFEERDKEAERMIIHELRIFRSATD